MLKNSEFGLAVSRFLGKVFGRLPMPPEAITALSLVFALAGYVSYDHSPAYALAFFALAFFAGGIDGPVAKAKNVQTRKGAFLGAIADRAIEFLVILTLFKTPIPILILQKEVWLSIVLFFGTGMTGYVKAYAEHTGVMRHERTVKMPGILEGAERSILILAVFVLVLLGSEYSATVLMFTATLSFLTVVERFARALSSRD